MTPNLTDAGKNLLLRALTGETITFTKIQLGNGPAQDAKAATGLVNPLLTVELSKIEIGEECVTLTAAFTNGTVVSGFHITEAGFYAKDPDDENKELLYALGNEDESTADYVPNNANRILEMEFNALLFIGDAENVAAAINSSLVYASAADLNAHTGNMENPHNVTKEQVGLGNVPNVATNDQTPTYADATTFATLSSGEKMGTAFGKIKLAITNLINHITNKSNPHNCTASQVGAAAKSHTHAATDINAGILSGHRGGMGISAPDYGALITGYDEARLQAINWSGALYSQGQNQPKSGVLPIEYGGTGKSDITSFATVIADLSVTKGLLSRSVSGTYNGNGSYGSANAKSFIFAEPPRLLIVMPTTLAHINASGQNNGFIALRGIQTKIIDGNIVYFTWEGRKVSWFSLNDELSQQNVNGVQYNYFAIL